MKNHFAKIFFEKKYFSDSNMLALILAVFLLFFAPFVFATVQDAYPFASSGQANRFALLTQEVRCVVCQNQNIADSNAPLANDLRQKIYMMVVANKSNREIKDYLVKRYGEFILLQPRFNKMTIALWLLPFLALLLMTLACSRLLRVGSP